MTSNQRPTIKLRSSLLALNVTILGKLEKQGLDELLLGHVSKAWLLLGERLTHWLRLLHDNLGDDWLNLWDGKRGLHFEVLGVPVTVD